MAWDLADRTSPTRPLQVTCPLVVSGLGDPRRPVPTATSVAAVELGPSVWQASSLRLSPHERAVCATQQVRLLLQLASPSRRPDSPPTPSSKLPTPTRAQTSTQLLGFWLPRSSVASPDPTQLQLHFTNSSPNKRKDLLLSFSRPSPTPGVTHDSCPRAPSPAQPRVGGSC